MKSPATTTSHDAKRARAPRRPRGDVPAPNVMLLNGREVAAMLGVGASTVWRLTQGGQLPKPIYPTRRAPRWHRAEIEAAISKMSRDPAKAPLTQEWDGSRLRAASVDPMS